MPQPKGPIQVTQGRVPGRVVCALICLYQRTLRGRWGGHCRFLPTCSDYAWQAFAQYGGWKAWGLTLKRLGSCHPFSRKDPWDPLP